MTRLTAALLTNPNYGFNKSCKNGRRPQRLEDLRTKPIREIALKNSVTGMGGRKKEVACIPEMMALFSCLEVNDFNQSVCAKESEAMQACYGAYLARREKIREVGFKEPVPGAKEFTRDQLNVLLSRYPQIVDK